MELRLIPWGVSSQGLILAFFSGLACSALVSDFSAAGFADASVVGFSAGADFSTLFSAGALVACSALTGASALGAATGADASAINCSFSTNGHWVKTF